MINRIKSALENNGITQYAITHTKGETRELYYIRKDLSMVRNNERDEYVVKVFKSFEKSGQKLLGNSSAIISETMSDKEINAVIGDAYFSAGFVSNLEYTLPSNEHNIINDDSFEGMSVSECANIMASALFKNDVREDVFINSAEIFVTKDRVHLITSNDIDVSYNECYISGEYVCQKKVPIDVETHSRFSYLTPAAEDLSEKVNQSLNNTVLRSETGYQIPSDKYNVMLTGESVERFFSFFTSKANATHIVSQLSNYKVGDNVQGENIKGDKLNITLNPVFPYSGEGVRMINRSLIEDGVLKVIHGDAKNSNRVGVETIGSYSGISVQCGKDDSSPEKYIEALIFSDFQIDIVTGFFGGELRLGILHDGENQYPITGCTINGNVHQVLENMKLSASGQKFLGYNGPKSITFNNISVTGNAN